MLILPKIFPKSRLGSNFFHLSFFAEDKNKCRWFKVVKSGGGGVGG